MVSHETLDEAIRIPDPQDCADRMIELALKGGGPDNVTVIVADVVDIDFGEDAPIVGGAAGDGSEDRRRRTRPPSRASAITAPRTEPLRIEPLRAAAGPEGQAAQARSGVVLVLLAAAGAVAGGAIAPESW